MGKQKDMAGDGSKNFTQASAGEPGTREWTMREPSGEDSKVMPTP
eukprot:CAMPEP_0113727964 /NCGR_PEP_ID=MMETSP0038_2-20120614/41551_1 /TAXON_ID=2898 /ORGANISM="Cryptomonas paramecium" /LENGTH=44 /DNA_ID=CAMNT_0000659283 /DNA_START=41 /DNA_END=171 /DNA_ORIENTATION=+ /assembly_acc=CAM_ASM_000170